jgi:hypothetical protein
MTGFMNGNGREAEPGDALTEAETDQLIDAALAAGADFIELPQQVIERLLSGATERPGEAAADQLGAPEPEPTGVMEGAVDEAGRARGCAHRRYGSRCC